MNATMPKKPEGITCMICGDEVHYIKDHLTKAHPGINVQDYQAQYPDAPMYSVAFKEEIRRRKNETASKKKENEEFAQKMAAKILPFTPPDSTLRRPMYEVFDIPLEQAPRKTPVRGQTEGDFVMVDVLTNLSPELQALVPDIDPEYVFDVEVTKDLLLALALNLPALAYGMHGTGKSTLWEQICARTNRPMVRVQHTETTEEAHIIGQMVVRNAATEFDLGPLADAMINGLVYLSDEYDIAHPGVHAVYQPVMEGKPLFIKEAPPHQRLIKPHPHFRFIATGNTNGSGDDTGLYSGTKIGNAANYSRFGVTVQVKYPANDTEVSMLTGRVGIQHNDAKMLVDLASRIREMYQNGELSLPISPRELITTARIAVGYGGKWRRGLELAYTNRLDNTQAEAVQNVLQRIFK